MTDEEFAILRQQLLSEAEAQKKARAEQYDRDEFLNRQIDRAQQAALQYRIKLEQAERELRKFQSKPTSTPLVPFRYKRAIQIEGETTCNEPQ